nr:PREDICTED: uncharacterized protein LOC108832699 [Raphanus sativus]
MDPEDQLEAILEGLPDEYKNVSDQIEGRDLTPSLTEVHEKLINFEAKLQASMAVPAPSAPVTANAVGYRGNNKHHTNRNNQQRGPYRGNQQPRPAQSQYSPRPAQYTPRPYLGRCQICGVHGHSARTCSVLQQQHNDYHTQPRSYAPWQPRANMVASPYDPNAWLLDSGATHHITSDLNNLALHQPYTGGEDVTIADGTGLQIASTGEGSQNGGSLAARQD